MSSLKSVLATLWRWLRNAAAILWRALVRYTETDSEQRAAAFAYYAFFALFPLLVLLVTIGTMFLGNQQLAAETITGQILRYLPEDPELAAAVVRTVEGVVQSRKSAGLIAFFVLAWGALRFFESLVHGVNRAWGTQEYTWWRMPMKNLLMLVILASALLIGVLLPIILDQIRDLYWKHAWAVGLDFGFMGEVFRWMRWLVSPLVLFYGFSMFYKFAPQRRTQLREVWSAAAVVTLGLNLLQSLFFLYTKNIVNFNALYGTFGSVLALLMWIYLSGSMILLGGCLCAARHEIEAQQKDTDAEHRAD
jgi:Ca2+-transporting ATPase